MSVPQPPAPDQPGAALSVLEEYFATLLHEMDEAESPPIVPQPEVQATAAVGDSRKSDVPESVEEAEPAPREPVALTRERAEPARESSKTALQEELALALQARQREALQRLLDQHITLAAVEVPVEAAVEVLVDVPVEVVVEVPVEAPSAVEPEIEPAVEVDASPVLAEAKSQPLIKTPSPDAAAPLPIADKKIALEAPAAQTSSAPPSPAAIKIDPLLQWGANGRPVWAKDSFDILLFSVSGLTLAVPLVALGHIVDFSQEKLTYRQGRSSWFMGILPSNVGEIRIINTALFVMPEKYNPDFLNTAEYAVTIHGLPWGLMVDSVKQPVRLQPDDVKWRSERSKRPWLAGTVKSLMCALIDIPQLAEMLRNSEQK